MHSSYNTENSTNPFDMVLNKESAAELLQSLAGRTAWDLEGHKPAHEYNSKGYETKVDGKSSKTSARTFGPDQFGKRKKTTSALPRGNQGFIGSNELITHEQSLAPLKLNLGPFLSDRDAIPNFLEALNGRGVVKSSWSGKMESSLDERHYHYEIFRHRMPGTAVSTYPYTSGNTLESYYALDLNVLWPYGINDTYLGQPISNAPHEFATGDIYIAPLNRGDYEDMQWNLNKLKLGTSYTDLIGPQYGPGTATGMNPLTAAKQFANQHELMPMNTAGNAVINEHAKQSLIQRNNAWANDGYPQAFSAGTQIAFQTPYIYKAHFKHGSIQYEFMNKGETGAKVEVIVYRVKRSSQCSFDYKDYISAIDTSRPSTPMYRNIQATIQGYVNTRNSKIGTDSLLGRLPEDADVTTNPDFPFMSEFKQTKQSANPLVEVMRNTFSMPCGGRRNVMIQLPGVSYNPCDIPQIEENVGTGPSPNPQGAPPTETTNEGYRWDYKANTISCIDQYSYVVCITSVGERMSRVLSKVNPAQNLTSDDNKVILDAYSDTNIQYYASYTENIGAVMYDKQRNNRVVVHGDLKRVDTSAVSDSVAKTAAGVVLEVAKTVRNVVNVAKKFTAAGALDSVTLDNPGNVGGH